MIQVFIETLIDFTILQKNECVGESLVDTMWKNEKCTVTQKKFRQINSLVFTLFI